MENLILVYQYYAQELSTETLCLSQVNTAHVHQWRNSPQPHYTRLISSSVRLLNEPIYYMGVKDTKAEQVAAICASFFSIIVDMYVAWNNHSKKKKKKSEWDHQPYRNP